DQRVFRALEQVAHDLAVHLDVFDVKNGFIAHMAFTRSGISIMNAEPLPSPLSTQMRPPCISTNFRLIDRPRPVPPYSLAMVASVCLNSVNRLSILSGGMPMPVSVTL